MVPFSKSRAPNAKRNGTPFNSYSANFQPGLCVSLLSNLTDMPFSSKAIFTLVATRDTASN